MAETSRPEVCKICPSRSTRTAKQLNLRIIGDPFLRKVSVVFDVDGTRVHVLPVGDKKGAALVAEVGREVFLNLKAQDPNSKHPRS